MDKEVFSERHFRNQLVKFDPDVLLQMCNRYSVKIASRADGELSFAWPGKVGLSTKPQTAIITQHKLAQLAMIAAQNYLLAQSAIPSDREFIRLANNVGAIESPIEKNLQMDPNSLITVLVRLTNQQFPFHEDLRPAIPRHLLLYLEAEINSPKIDPDDVMRKSKELGILDFITLGLCFYLMSQSQSTFGIRDIQDIADSDISPYVTDDKIKAFLAIVGGDLRTLRELCLKEEKQSPGAGLYRFNSLFDRPVIVRKDSSFCIPVPFLMIYAVTKGLYYDLLDEFNTKNGNPFSEWFGHAFEQYGGALLHDSFDNKNVFPEPEYGKERKRGPDWIVKHGETAIIFEFRSGRLHKKAKTYGDYEEIVLLMRRNLIETIKKLPGKINDLKTGKTGIDLSGITNYVPIIITYEPLDPPELFLDIVSQELHKEKVPEFNFELMSINDLELVLAWSAHEDIVKFITEKWSDPKAKSMSAGKVAQVRASKQGLNILNNGLLEETMRNYWKKIAST